MIEPFLFTVPSGEPIEVEPFHYAIIGQTQFSGKTTLIKRLSKWAVDQGFKVLIFDTKETAADYPGFGREIPVCLRETTDSFVLIGLLESLFKRRLTHYYATLSRITEEAEGFDDIIGNARELEGKTRSSWLKDACRVLYDLLERLKAETAKVETVPQLNLYRGLNRMVINTFSLEAQQLIVKNAYEDLLRIYKRDSIGVLDEAFKFIPQGYSSPATRSIMQVMTQGGKTKLFTWISTQFLAVTDKGPLKACPFKFLGTQDHTTEIKHTLELIPEARGKFSSDDIMRLKLGHWILVRKRPPDVRIVYALPVGVPAGTGRKVAIGELTPEDVRDHFLKIEKEDDDLVYKEKWKEEKRRREELEQQNKALREQNEEMRKAGLDRYHDELEQLKDEKADLGKQLEKTTKSLVEVKKKADAFDELQKALALFRHEDPAAGFTTLSPGAGVTIAEVDERINQRLAGPEPARVVTVDVDERIKELVKNDILNRIVAKIQSLPEPAKKAALWMHEKEAAKIGELYSYIYDKIARRIPGSFYANVVKPLEQAWLISNEAGNVRWVLEEKLSAELKDLLRNGDVQNLAKYLISLLL